MSWTRISGASGCSQKSAWQKRFAWRNTIPRIPSRQVCRQLSRLAKWPRRTPGPSLFGGRSLSECGSSHLLEDRDRGRLRRHHSGWIDKESLLESELAGENRMGHCFGVDHPARPCWEIEILANAGTLKICVFFHCVVQLHHELVVRCPLDLRH